jgi:hypothetical protein
MEWKGVDEEEEKEVVDVIRNGSSNGIVKATEQSKRMNEVLVALQSIW